MKISQDIITLIKYDDKVKDFLSKNVDVDVFIKKLTSDELERINKEYPKLLNLFDEDHLNNPSIVVLTLVKRDNDEKNYIQLKKIKLYIDESNKKIIKILEN